jgi:hypothetical protein
MSQSVKLLPKKFLSVSDSRYQFNKFIAGLREEFKPQGFYEDFLVNKLGVDYWRLKKALIYERDHIYQNDQAGEDPSNNKVSQFVNYVKSIEKSIEDGKKALKEAKNNKSFGSSF